MGHDEPRGEKQGVPESGGGLLLISELLVDESQKVEGKGIRSVPADDPPELFKGILDIWAEELPMICTVGQDLRSIIMKNDMRNYSAQGKPFWGDVDDAMDAPTLFYEDPAAHA